MATKLYFNPFVPAYSNIGVPLSQAKLYFYLTGTTTLANIYADAAQTTPLANPVQANLAGKYPDIYLDAAITYKVQQTDANGTPIGDAVDPYTPGTAIGTETYSTIISKLTSGSGGGTTNFLRANGTWAAPPASAGTVTSVAVAGPAIFSITGGPITTNGTITLSLANQNANLVWAGPSSGAAAAPTFRTLVSADLPPNIQTVTSASTVTPTFTNDQVNITAQAAALNLANPTGTAQDAFGMVIRIKDNGTARAITYGTQYRAIGTTLPTTTVASKTLYLGMIYNAADTKWDVVSVVQE